jgi:hypothetical protein
MIRDAPEGGASVGDAVATSWQHSVLQLRPMCPPTSAIGRSRRRRTYLARVYEVEGLVGSFPRGGSSPLERMRSGWKSGMSHRREVAREFQQAGRGNGVATAGSASCVR